MYLFGNTYFELITIKRTFQVVFIFFLISEIFIWCFTSWISRKHSGEKQNGDKGSYFLLVAGFVSIIFLNLVCRKQIHFILPMLFFWIGIFFIIIGVLFRSYSVWTLRNFFTLSVQVNSTQKIIQTGPYKYLRHPSYSGSILSLIGITLSFRSFEGVIGTLIIIVVIYGYRITIEETILEKTFKETYKDYKDNTYRIIPFIW
ncbi:isoprenylcysteine carboxylmethyltransferase family protein [Clostridium sp. CM027]|uniref:methyltransferase family protein n=1 Tax=Clostridium sp. CM027 TaxID=2849865 RepID=UPI001C6E7B37|nr:isoprenylcysteine carboxylmethyltransferase family protein [Clostridium sp. CM027]MBW9146649.1 isoprenylcysteine carboxylmethyltransferase family protein [Clostridium sp. CM027]UVE42030.1 isoprenylcysteine carboxylmethyltransferase family protein [Clostridium sp. CM027]